MWNEIRPTNQTCEVPLKAGKSNFYFDVILFTTIFSFSIKMAAQTVDSPSRAWVKSLSTT